MSSDTAAAVAAGAEVIELQPDLERNTVRFNMLGLPRISDDEHFERAIASGFPHSYLCLRAGRMQYQGEDGIGFVNAAVLHARVMCRSDYDLNEEDIEYARSKSPSFQAGVERLAWMGPDTYRLFQCLMPEAFTIPRPPSFDL
jgi:hypothetical protein